VISPLEAFELSEIKRFVFLFTSSSRSILLPAIPTCQPLCAKRLATSIPIPEVAPITIAFFAIVFSLMFFLIPLKREYFILLN
jgi:hypothetical protein